MTAMNRIPSGYKQTEVGVIPEDWSVTAIKNLNFDISDGNYSSKYPKASDFRPIGVPFIRANNIHNMKVVDDDMRFISSEQHNELLKGHLKKNDVLITTRGEIGQIALVQDCHVGSNINAQIVRINTGNQTVDFKFLAYTMSSKSAKEQLGNLETGSALKQLPVGKLVQLLLVVPPLPEQRAIATALSDMDALLAAQDKLIAKKRDIKQATMQQLLTGKQRLPGFGGEWEVKRLGDVSLIKTGKKNNEDKIEEGAYPFFVRSQTVERINSYCFDGEAILVPGEGNIGSIFHYINGKFDYHQRVYKISDFDVKTSGKFIYFCMLQTFNDHAMRNSVKATVDSLRLPTFKEFEFVAPPTIEEQSAIATVLSDMDADLAALEQQRDKTRALKQGMMQELLTGRIRLV